MCPIVEEYKVSKIAFAFFMMSEARWTAVETVVTIGSKQSIVIELPVNVFVTMKCPGL